MKKFYTVFIFIFSYFILNAQEITIYGDWAYSPYSYEENDKMDGIYTIILHKVFSQMDKYNIEIKGVPWKRGLDLLERGNGFALYPPYYHPEKRPYMDYSVPILKEEVIVIARKEVMDGTNRKKWPDDFHGLKVVQNEGFDIGGKEYNSAVKSGKIEEVRAKSTEACFLMVGVGRADVYISDRLAALSVLNSMKQNGAYDEGGKHSVLVEGPSVNIEWGYLGITNRDQGKYAYKEEFLKEFDKIVTKMKESGEIEKIINDFVNKSK